MKLISLELEYFRQHLDSRITFCDGLTGIIGPNGAGKTTILEAIAWALYGSPAVRGSNETIRSMTCEGGAKARVCLSFELAGSIYRTTRTLDGSGRSTAVLEADGRALSSGMSEVSAAVARLLGMDYRAFFTSFFTGQKDLEFMGSFDTRTRAATISRMLGYERLVRAREQANQDRLGLTREIDGLQSGLPDPNEIKERKNQAQRRLSEANAALEAAEAERRKLLEAAEKLRPLVEVSNQKASRHAELSRRIELDRAEVERGALRLAQVRAELADLREKKEEFEAIRTQLSGFREAADEFKKLGELQKYDAERQRLTGQIAALKQDVGRLEAKERHLADARDQQLKADAALSEAEALLRDVDAKILRAREKRIADLHSLESRIRELETQRAAVSDRRQQIEAAGEEGECPTCERPLGRELPVVLANLDRHIAEIDDSIRSTRDQRAAIQADETEIGSLERSRQSILAQLTELREAKSAADTRVSELTAAGRERAARIADLGQLEGQLSRLPSGFDQARFDELSQLRESLQPVRDRANQLKPQVDRIPRVEAEESELAAAVSTRSSEIEANEKEIAELAFSAEDHSALAAEFESCRTALSAADVRRAEQQGEVNAAAAILEQAVRDEQTYRSKVEDLNRKQSDRLHLQTVADAFDALRTDLNDRIRPELESVSSELLSMMTDGRYNVIEIGDDYRAMIRDDGELKQVISGGEDDVMNLALRLAVSQMIAERAGQSFSLLVLDEVFGSLDDTRRENVVTLLQNLKNRFEQIVLITHVESIHDALDNCLWVQFDEKTKTSTFVDRSQNLALADAISSS